MKKFAKWLVMVFVVSCLCGLILTMTGCGDKEPTIKSIKVDNGKLVAIYDDDTTKDLGVLSNIVSAKEENGNLVITLVDGKEITVSTSGIAGKYVVGVSTANGKIVITYNDNTTGTIDLPTTATCEHKEAEYEVLKEHKIEKDEEGNFNCVEPGFVIMMCPDCGEVKYIKTTEHRIEKKVVAPTCTEKGYTIEKCLYCDYGAGDSEKTDFTDTIPHNYGEPVKVKDEGCEKPFQTLKICKDCGHAEPEVQPAPGHEIVIDEETLQVPSNTATGSVVGNCENCDYTITFTLPVLSDEDYTSTPVGKKDRCDELGKVKYSIGLTAGDLKKVTIPYEFEVNGVAGKHKFCENDFLKDDTIKLTQEEFDAKKAEGKIKMLNGAELTCKEDVKAQAIVTCETCGMEAITVYVTKDHEEDTSIERVITKPATCTSKGSYTYTCKGCGKDDLVGELAETAHTYTDIVKKIPAGDGKYTYTVECGKCGHIETILDVVDEIQADCQHDGKLIYKLDGVEKEFTLQEKTGHIIAVIDGVNKVALPTDRLLYSEFKGYIKTILNDEKPENANCKNAIQCLYECKVCHDDRNTVWLLGDHVIPKDENGEPILEHHEPACEVEGYDSYICKECGELQKINIVSALQHEYEYVFDGDKTLTGTCKHNPKHTRTVICDDVKIKEVKATCKEKGSKTYECYKDGELIDTVYEEIPVSNVHSHKVNGEDVPVVGPLKITPADYAKDGGWLKILNGDEKHLCDGTPDVQAMYDCSVCGVSYTVVVYADHERTADDSKPATCTEDGHDKYKCSRCGKEFDEVVPAKGHKYSVTLKYEEGKVVAYKTCTVCSNPDKDVTDIVLTDDLLVTAECVAATCKDAGLKVYKVTYENEEYTIKVTVPKTTDHQTEDSKEITWEVEDKENDCIWIYTGKLCSSCGEIIVTNRTSKPIPEEPTTNV